MNRSLLFLALVACGGNDFEVVAHKRALSTNQATFDAGMVAVGDRQTLQVWLASTGQGDVTVYDIYVDDEEHWGVSPNWTSYDEEQGVSSGTVEGTQIIKGGSDTDPSYGLVEVIFKPDSEAQFRTTLTIVSNDDEVTERVEGDDTRGVWRVVLRGIGRYPCARVYPVFYDFGPRAAGGYFSMSGTVENCGNVKLTVQDFDVTGPTSFYVASPTPIYVLPQSTEPIEIAYEPAGGTPIETAEISLDLNDPDFTQTLQVQGNDCENSVDTAWDGDNDGWFECGGDCDDTDGSISPSSQEKADNGKNDDCDGMTDEPSNNRSVDNDGDGYTEEEGDCDDMDADISPAATEVLNQIDDDCDGFVDETTEWYDDDGDGFSERAGDCDDSNDQVYPGAPETGNDIDDDCDGFVDEGGYLFDDDDDGYPDIDESGAGMDDCNDEDAWTFPGAQEDCDDRDNDCDGLIDEGENDEEGGACTFLVERQIAPQTQPPSGCSTTGRTGSLAGLLGLLAGLALVASRRR